jgi:hypothetical protein
MMMMISKGIFHRVIGRIGILPVQSAPGGLGIRESGETVRLPGRGDAPGQGVRRDEAAGWGGVPR